MLKRLALLAVIAAALVSFAGSAGAITGNYSKDFTHNAVGLLVFYTTPDPVTGDPFSHRCSGTLIDSRTIVTAGHCTEGVDKGRVYFQQSVAPNYDPNAFGGWGGDPTTGYPYQNGVTFSVADNYGFHNFEGYPNNLDVGVVELDVPVATPRAVSGSCRRPVRSTDISRRPATRSRRGSRSAATACPTRIRCPCPSASGSRRRRTSSTTRRPSPTST